jgi:3-deoxy-D-manno-octulosonic-acid transferase
MGYFLLILLNILSPLGALAVLVFFFLSPRRGVLKKLREELRERFVLYPYTELFATPVWIHCASVGEVNSMQSIIPQLKDLYNKPVLITTNTWAGRAAALKNPDVDNVYLIPFDFYPLTRKFVKLVKPVRMFIVEGELWPNNIMACVNNKIPVCIINGRVSAKSAKRYKLLSPLFSLMLKNISFAALQSEEIKQRYISLGLPAAAAHAPGNIKYDSLRANPPRTEEVKDFFNKINWQNKKILICGSTHVEEENLIFKNAEKFYKENIRVVIAPRHLERKTAIIDALKKSGLAYNTLSHDNGVKDPAVLVADAMGWLTSFYAAGDLAFVGGTIAKKGGHNLLEPAILSKPVLFGPHVYNTPDTADALLKNNAAAAVDKDNFSDVIIRISKDKNALPQMAGAALRTARSFQGATAKTMELIKNYERTRK